MCTGRVDLDFVLRAFANGMDGVFIGGCRLNECNYVTQGNFHALNIALLSKRLLEYIGLDPRRLSIEFMSAGEGNRFADIHNAFADEIRGLGPLGVAEGLSKAELKTKLAEVRGLVPYIKQVKKVKLRAHLNDPAKWDDYFTRDEVRTLLTDVFSYYIQPDKCTACMICARRCPEQCITSGKNMIHVIQQDKCIKCGTCQEVCPVQFAAVAKLAGNEPVPPPLPEDQRAITRKAKETA